MSLSYDRLEAAKRYMRVDGTDDDETVSVLCEAAETYLNNAGITPKPENALYNMAVYSLALYYFDHRDAVSGEASFPAGLRPVVNQLKLMEEYGDEEV